MSTEIITQENTRSILISLAEKMATYGYTSVDVIKYTTSASCNLGRFSTPDAMADCILNQNGPVEVESSREYQPDDQTVTVDPAGAPDQLFVTFSPFAALELTLNSLTETHGPNEELVLAYLRSCYCSKGRRIAPCR